MLKINGAVKEFGGIHAVNNCSFEVGANSITGLIGPNGAGKTTLFNLIAGTIRLDSGEVWFKGNRIDNLPAHKIARSGLSRTFQIPRMLEMMTVLENLMLVPSGQLGEKLWNSWFRLNKVKEQEISVREKANQILEFLELTHLKSELAGNLSVGQKKLLELGRTLMADPAMILLDEPGAGVNPSLLKKIVNKIRLLKNTGKTFLLIEHDMDLVMDLCERVIVMNNGSLLAEGLPEEVRSNPEVLDAYLVGQAVRGEA